MSYSDAEAILQALLRATTPTDVHLILQELGDNPDIGLDNPFGPFSLAWHAFGDNPSNISTIGLATKAGRSLGERLTNAMDALLEERHLTSVSPVESPRTAAKQWFGRPVSGPDEGLFKWSYTDQDYDRRSMVVLSESGEEMAPTVDVYDSGIGISPEDFPKTILSLQAGNKIKKRYLIGAFGQGGASTLAFCEYAIIVSRNVSDPRNVGFTVVRVVKLDASWKEDCYAYLCLQRADGAVTVPSCQSELPTSLYQPIRGIKLPSLAHGTLVRHVAFKLPNLDGKLGPGPGNLYHFLHASLFDPLLPFRLIDLRTADKARDEIVTGSRNRLMKLVQQGVGAADDEDSGSQIRHYRPMEFVVPFGSQQPSVGIEYWVVLNYRKGKADHPVLRGQSNELYIQTGLPVLGTLNGQNQGELRAKLVKDLGLGMVARHLVVNIDATNADSRVRRELFSTSREGFKDGTVLHGLTQVLEKMLEEDEVLREVERELTERLAKRESESTRDDVKRQVTQLLLEAGLQVSKEGPSTESGDGEPKPTSKPRKGGRQKASPLPTLPFPEVTKFTIVWPRPNLSIHQHDIETVYVETDADAEYDRQQRLAIRSEPDCLELAAKVPLQGGRVRWRLRPRQTAKAGDVGKVVVTITRPDGTQLSDQTTFEVLAPKEDKSKKTRGIVPPFEIIPINPEDDPDIWETVWPKLGEGADDEAKMQVAYCPTQAGGGINVYYSTIFGPFQAQMQKLKNQAPTLVELFTSNYEIWIGYHAILQEAARTDETDLTSETLDRLLEQDRIRVATMQVKQATKMAEMQQKSLQVQEQD